MPELRATLRRLRPAAALLALLGVAATPAAAAPQLGWSSAATFDAANTPTALSCPSESLCVAVDSAGNALTSADPGAAAPQWTPASIDAGGAPLQAVSCAAEGPCVAVDGHGHALADARPGASAWSSPSAIDGGTSITGVSCPSSSLCVAADAAGQILWSANPTSSSWHPVAVDTGHSLRGISCASPALCVAVDDAGRILSSNAPTGGAGAWRTQPVDFAPLRAISCAAAGCVAVDADGQTLASANPVAAAPTWSITPVDAQELTAVSCAASGLCTAVDTAGSAFASDDATSPAPTWASAPTHAGSLAGVACVSTGLCVAVDREGREVSARPPAPAVTTESATHLSATEATLAASVDPRDAALRSCGIEYATGKLPARAAVCVPIPSAAGGTQLVTATAAGLEPNTTYHYRAFASSASGETGGAELTFTTPASSAVPIVHPHPSISGTPAPKQTLTCNPGTEAVATFGYAWVRDQVVIAGANQASYTVAGRDSGHHLQCQVTATDGGGSATARSAFVTVPAGGVPAAAGETAVGLASYRNGRVAVPVTCSSHATAGCAISARLTTTQPAPGGRHRTVALAAKHATIVAGAHAPIVLTLTKPARRLLARRKRLAAQLAVTGTVIGVIQARLASERLTITPGRAARATRLAGRSAASQRGGLHAPAPAPDALAVSRSPSGKAAGPAAASLAAPRSPSRKVARTAAAALAATPYMGWDTYFALGGRYSESSVLEQASRLITLGLRQRGFRYVWLDVGWWHGARSASGQIEVSHVQWPHGLGWLTATLHAAGFRVGLYTDAGPNGCGGAGQGSYGRYQQDADTSAAWGFDAVKVDFCGGSEYQLEPRAAYTAFRAAIDANSSRRPMLLSICNFLLPGTQEAQSPTVANSAFGSFSFGPGVGNSWRTDIDVGTPGNVSFANVLRNMDADAASPQAAGPGHWNDPDYLAPDQGMSAAQFRTQLSMWSMLAAPLMVSDDLRTIGAAGLRALQNSEVLAVDQDPAGVQATLVSATGNGEVWARPLAGGSRAVALLNRGSRTITIQTSAGAVGLSTAARYSVRNLWSHTTKSSAGPIAASVPPYSTVMLRVSG